MEPLQHNATRGSLFARLSEWREQVEFWCAGRSWLGRAPLLLWLAYVAVRHVADPLYTSLFGSLNLALHEGGHLLSSSSWGALVARPPDPPLAPRESIPLRSQFLLRIFGMRVRQPDCFGDGECVICHDWGYMLGQLGMLSLDTTLASLVRILAFIVMWSSLAAGGWMLWRMALPSPWKGEGQG